MYLIPAASLVALYTWTSQQDYQDMNHLTYLAALLLCVNAFGGISNQAMPPLGNALGMIDVSLGK